MQSGSTDYNRSWVSEKLANEMPAWLDKLIKRSAPAPAAGPAPSGAALFAQALALRDAGRLGEAEIQLRALQGAFPEDANLHYHLGMVLQMQGKRAEAREAYGAALALAPAHADAHNNLGVILKEEGQVEQALRHHRSALASRPGFVDAINNIGTALQSSGKLDEALEQFDAALALQPGHPGLHYNKAAALQARGDIDAAIGRYREAARLDPGLAIAHSNLGCLLVERGELAEAEAHFLRVLELHPDLDEARVNLGSARLGQNKFDDAQQEFETVLKRNPKHARASLYLGWSLIEQGDFPAAAQHYRRALELQPDYAEAHDKLGSLLKDKGQIEAALACFRRALELKPDFVLTHSNLCLAMNYAAGVPPGEIYAEHLRFAQRHCAGLAPPRHANVADPDRRLRIGYVSGDFRAHVIAHFIEPVLANHDHARFEVFCYYNFHSDDGITARLRGYADHWRRIFGLGEQAVARAVLSDGIDILVDLSGHTGLNRMLVFARKPAPVQVTYLGYPTTTGLTAIDYRITDAAAEPPGAGDAHYVEKLIRLPDSLWCYRPAATLPEIAPLPALREGRVTFASLNNYSKVGREVIELWARLLRELPNSRILFATVPPGDARTQLLRSLDQLGVRAERVELLERMPPAQFWNVYKRVDLALDPFPCGGGTTTCEALWMGVPVISLIGEAFLSRAGFSLLTAAGLAQFAARNAEDYVAIAAHWAHDLPRLGELRAGMRTRLEASPLCDAPRFTRNLEAAYRAMWKTWCAKQ